MRRCKKGLTKIEKMQERFNKDLEEIKKSQYIMNNTINEIRNTLEATKSRDLFRKSEIPREHFMQRWAQ